jgi:hypothetical protein
MEISMYKRFAWIGAFLSPGIVCFAQTINTNPNSTTPDISVGGLDGAHLYEVSIFSGYSSSAYPVGQYVATSVGALNADVNYGASVVAGWQRHRQKGNLAITYSGSYSGMAHYSNANGYSQWLTLSADRKLAPKWTATLTGNGQDGTLLEVLNQPTGLSVISQAPTDISDLAAALGLGNFSSAQAASMILGAPVVQTPLRSLLLGDKVLNYSGAAGLNYLYSRHLTFHVSGFGSGGQNRSSAYEGLPATNFVLPHSYGAEAGLTWTSSLSPRTDVSLNLNGNRIQSTFQTGYTATATASIGRKMGPHWFARVYGGGTYADIIQQVAGMPQYKQIVGGASMGYKTTSQTFAATYDRSSSDSYASFIGTYSSFSGSWHRHRPSSRFSMFASAGQQQVANTGFESFSGWTANAGCAEQLTNTVSMDIRYVYFRTAGNFEGTASGFSVNSVRLSIKWSPEQANR